MQRDQQRRKRSHNQVAERTTMRRPSHNLLPGEAKRAKEMRDSGMTFQEIAGAIGQPVRDVELAIAATRSRNPDSPFAVINTDTLTKDRFLAFRLPDDGSEHDVLVRLLNQAEAYRRLPKSQRAGPGGTTAGT